MANTNPGHARTERRELGISARQQRKAIRAERAAARAAGYYEANPPLVTDLLNRLAPPPRIED